MSRRFLIVGLALLSFIAVLAMVIQLGATLL
jgi:hypothetical protein